MNQKKKNQHKKLMKKNLIQIISKSQWQNQMLTNVWKITQLKIQSQELYLTKNNLRNKKKKYNKKNNNN